MFTILGLVNDGGFTMIFRCRVFLFLIALTLVGFAATNTRAQTTFTFDTPVGASASGGAVDATATFTVTGNTITITLTNLQANPKSVGQLLSGLDFTLSTGQNRGSLSDSSAQQIMILKGGNFSLGSVGSTGWGLANDCDKSGGLQLTALGFEGPANLLIGPSGGTTYGDANGSIAGNKPHNPFLDQTATFTIKIPCLNGSATITGVTFLFGTGDEDGDGSRDGVVGVGAAPAVTPEPATMLLFGSGLAALGFARRRRTQSAR